jgi:Uma2 family endonuclease
MNASKAQLNHGTPLVWLVDPESRTVTVYRPGKQHYVLREDDELTGEDVLPDFKCKVRDFSSCRDNRERLHV